MDISDRIKGIADDYIRNVFPDGCTPLQGIELKLAVYFGMMATMAELSTIRTQAELDKLHQAIKVRALRLNEERSGLFANA